MSKPMTSTQFVNQLKKWNIKYKPFTSGWANHNRGDRGNGFSDVNGIIQHHTASESQTIQKYLSTGSSGLPGPLCQVATDKKGVLWLIGWGRANHAGKGDSVVLSKVIAEEYTGTLKPRSVSQGGQNYDGNGRFYGNEAMYSGVSSGMTSAQYNTCVLFAAAICDFHNWTAKSFIGHGEWSSTKWDPGNMNKRMNMPSFRDDVEEALELGPGNWPKKPEPPVEEEPEVPEDEEPNQKTYKVQNEDTLWGIAERFYGSGKSWPKLVELNSSLINLEAGITIKLKK